jgi:hypothetical protein
VLRWVELAPEAAERPPARLDHFAAIDPDADEMIVLGGFDPYCCGSPYRQHVDVWTLDLATERWREAGRIAHPLLGLTPVEVAFDAPRHRLVIVGASFDFERGPLRDVAVDVRTWAITEIPGRPFPRDAQPLRAAWDRERGRILVSDAYFTERTAGLWSLDLATDRWTTLPGEGDLAQLFHTPLTKIGPDRAIVYSGYTGETGSEDLWYLDLRGGRWTPSLGAGEDGGRFGHRCVFEPANAMLAVFGGSLFLEDRGLTLFDMRTGGLLLAALVPTPPSRRDFTFVLDGPRRRAIAFGGAHQSERAYADTWALEFP